MKFICMIAGTIITILFIICLLKGRTYDEWVEGLEKKMYPLRGIYGAGFVLANSKIIAIKNLKYDELNNYAKLYYEPKYADYYAQVIWAQVLSFASLILGIGLILSGILNSGFFVLLTIGFAAAATYFFLTQLKNRLKKREEECLEELPEVVSTMALLINSGMIITEVWNTVAYSKDGEIYNLMKESCEDINNGVAVGNAIHKFGVLSNSPNVRKFASMLVQSIDKGGRELAEFLAQQSTEMLNLKRQLLLQKGEVAASKLIFPTALIFVGIMLMIIITAMGTLL